MLLSGQTRLMGVQDLSDLDRLRELFEAFARKREILQLLERTHPGARACACSSARKPAWRRWTACRVVTAPYARRRPGAGRAGRHRPTRMAYERVIPMVQATADLLGRRLESGRQPRIESRCPA